MNDRLPWRGGLAAVLLSIACSQGSETDLSSMPPAASGAAGQSGAAGSSATTAGGAGAGGSGASPAEAGSAGLGGASAGSAGTAGSAGSAGGEPVEATDFTCSQVTGLMITGEWYNAGFEQGGVDPDKWQLKNQHYGYIGNWIDPNSEFWNAPVTSPCASGSTAPDRVLFVAVDWEFTTQGQWETALEQVVATIQVKYPGVRRIELMTMVRCPDNQQCNPNASIEPGANYSAAIQDCQVTDYQDAAMATVAAAHPGLVGVAPKFESPHCREPPDGAHLTPEDNAAAAQEIATYYAALP